jgi:hypothetical protein
LLSPCSTSSARSKTSKEPKAGNEEHRGCHKLLAATQYTNGIKYT